MRFEFALAGAGVDDPVAYKEIPVGSDDLVPGDIVSINASGSEKAGRKTPSAAGLSCPCDALLLHGSAVVNEAMLTGESVPKLKESLGGGGIRGAADPSTSTKSSNAGEASARTLAFTDGTDKRHLKNVLFCGTQILKLEMSDSTKTRSTGALKSHGGGGVVVVNERERWIILHLLFFQTVFMSTTLESWRRSTKMKCY